LNARALSVEVLLRVAAKGESLNVALETVLPRIPEERDRALVKAFCFGVARWHFRLDFILRQLAPKPIRDESIRLLLLLGLYQLEYTRVKPHAAVAETVEAAGRKTWAKALVNGVLRAYQRERERLADLADRDAVAASAHPRWLLDLLREDWPDDWQGLIEQNNRQAPMSLRVYLSRCARETYLETLAQAGFAARPGLFADSAAILESPAAVERLPGFAEGWVSVQDEAAQLAAGLMALEPGLRVLDLCAAPGGKTVHILESCSGLADLVAVDIDPERIALIRENLARAGLRAKLRAGDSAKPSAWWDGRPFERILLDAPCSATGVIRRHPDIKLLRRPEDLAVLAATQTRLLEAAWSMLAEGGLLLYATCSVARRENEQRIADFLAAHPDARESPIEADWGRPCAHGRRIATGEADMDGFYYARLLKPPRASR
jgi:16S rRNA (cytosine967-C5)-methyltransferase